jgi:hypothetical protein
MPPAGEEFAAALLGAVLPSLISNAFNRFGNALDAAGKEHTWQSTAFTNFEVGKSHMPKCVQIVRGEFLSTKMPSGEGYDFNTANDRWAKLISPYETKGGQLARVGVRLARRPDFFFEGMFRPSTDPSVMALVPIFVDFSRPLGTRAFRLDQKRHVSLTFAFHPPGKTATDPTNPSTNLVLGELSPEAPIDFDYSCGRDAATVDSGATAIPVQPSGPPPLSAGSPPAAGGMVPSRTGEPAKAPTHACANESLWFRLTRGDDLAPLSLTVATTEVQGKNEFLMFLSDVFKGSKEGLEKLSQEALIESEREKSRLLAIQTDNEAAVAYDQSATAALTALEACKAEPTISKAGGARVKQQATNLAAAKAGIAQPFITLVPLNGSAETIKQACSDALTNFR